MLKIKLARFGKKKQPEYRIIVNEAKTKRDGKYIDLLGFYSPTQEPKVLKIDEKKYNEWISKGAQPTETVASLFEKLKNGEKLMPKRKKVSKKAKKRLAEQKKKQEEQKKEKESDKQKEEKKDDKQEKKVSKEEK